MTGTVIIHPAGAQAPALTVDDVSSVYLTTNRAADAAVPTGDDHILFINPDQIMAFEWHNIPNPLAPDPAVAPAVPITPSPDPAAPPPAAASVTDPAAAAPREPSEYERLADKLATILAQAITKLQPVTIDEIHSALLRKGRRQGGLGLS